MFNRQDEKAPGAAIAPSISLEELVPAYTIYRKEPGGLQYCNSCRSEATGFLFLSDLIDLRIVTAIFAFAKVVRSHYLS